MRLRRAAMAAFLSAAMAGMPAPSRAEAIKPDAARQYIAALGHRTVAALAAQGKEAERSARFTAIMLESLDFEALGASSLGKLARAAAPQEKREFTALFAAYVIDVAIQKFGDLRITGFALGEATPQPNGDVKVFSRIAGGDRPLEVHWRVHEADGRPKINDIEVGGYSLAIHYRGEFERTGLGAMPELTARLKELTKFSKTLPAVQQAMR